MEPLSSVRKVPVGEPVVLAQSVQEVGYGLDDRGSIPGRSNDGVFILRHCVQTGSGAHLVSYQMGVGGSYPGDKANEARS
jgi:hypothetical protein